MSITSAYKLKSKSLRTNPPIIQKPRLGSSAALHREAIAALPRLAGLGERALLLLLVVIVLLRDLDLDVDLGRYRRWVECLRVQEAQRVARRDAQACCRRRELLCVRCGAAAHAHDDQVECDALRGDD